MFDKCVFIDQWRIYNECFYKQECLKDHVSPSLAGQNKKTDGQQTDEWIIAWITNHLPELGIEPTTTSSGLIV